MLNEHQTEHIQSAAKACARRAVYFREKADHFRAVDRTFRGFLLLILPIEVGLQLHGDTMTATAIALVLFILCIRRTPLRSGPLAKEGEQIADHWNDVKRGYETLRPDNPNADSDIKDLDSRTNSLLATSLAYPYDASGRARLKRFADTGEIGLLS